MDTKQEAALPATALKHSAPKHSAPETLSPPRAIQLVSHPVIELGNRATLRRLWLDGPHRRGWSDSSPAANPHSVILHSPLLEQPLLAGKRPPAVQPIDRPTQKGVPNQEPGQGPASFGLQRKKAHKPHVLTFGSKKIPLRHQLAAERLFFSKFNGRYDGRGCG